MTSDRKILRKRQEIVSKLTQARIEKGLSLFNFAMPDDLENLDDYAKTRTTPYRISFEDVCRAIMGSKRKNQLRKPVKFNLTRHPLINLPKERLQAIENHIQKRGRELLAIPNT